MYLSKEEREEMSELSKVVFGSRSHWQKILSKGSKELLTRQTTEVVPGKDGAEATTKDVNVPVMTEYGAKQFYNKQYTMESLKEHMLALKTQRDGIIEMINRQNEQLKIQAEKEKLLKTVNESTGGSAI